MNEKHSFENRKGNRFIYKVGSVMLLNRCEPTRIGQTGEFLSGPGQRFFVVNEQLFYIFKKEKIPMPWIEKHSFENRKGNQFVYKVGSVMLLNRCEPTRIGQTGEFLSRPGQRFFIE